MIVLYPSVINKTTEGLSILGTGLTSLADVGLSVAVPKGYQALPLDSERRADQFIGSYRS